MNKLLIALLIISGSVFAHGHHDTYDTTNGTNETIIQTTSLVRNQGLSLMALASSGHQFDWGTNALQWSISGGFADGREAISFQLGHKLGNVLINGGIATTVDSETDYAVVISATGHF